jgi:hypothetical protein
MVGSQSCGRERGNERVTSKDTTQLLNAQTYKLKKGYHAQRNEVRLEGILRTRLMLRRDCRIATAITWTEPRACLHHGQGSEPLSPSIRQALSTRHGFAIAKLPDN